MSGTRTGLVRQRGVALVTALLVVALATVAAVAMATRLHVDLRRTGNLIHGEQSYDYALAAESWAQIILRRDANDSKYDALDEDWATALPPLPVEGGYVSGKVSDLQGRFNVNNLVDTNGQPSAADIDYFKRLLTVLKLDPELANPLVDWIDPDINALLGGAEDDTYLLADPPYRAANRKLTSISELRLVQGYTDEVLQVLMPHVTALPESSTLNVNTVTAELLLALDENMGMTEQGVAILLADREDKPFEDLQVFRAHNALAGLQLYSGIDIASRWFLVRTDVAVGIGRVQLESVLRRDGGRVQVISRTRVTDYVRPSG